ncbi:aldo/keto reductase [Chryseobacterium sp.]|jgi:aryl-alcohol dehydrogenase-like predicted oxidoreductase|uniref:aldo/keto reductase n=1 Tax=Chryseobacterium sp. TaxID=1871047 RepID=UPI0028403190|nr:aldo/keto reductase [Chryseobacterium sp.]MDR3025022.1 aldo/keto reductase [Chryseobacterium sp.]
MDTSIQSTFLLGDDLEINRMGHGAMRITAPDLFGMPENPQNSIDVLQRAVELGVNFIDTADQYGPFVSEQLIAEALHPYQDNVIIGTKGGLVRFGPWADINNDASPQHLQDALDGSLRRLKLERIDLYQLHRIDPKVPAEISFEFLAKAQQQGKIRHIGLSEVSVDEIKHAQQYFNVVSVQNRYSVMERQWESVLEYCQSQGIAFIPWFPIGGGMTPMKEKLQNIADRKGVSIHQLALSWLLHRADNILLIPGTSSLQHLEENIDSQKIRLDQDDLNELNTLADNV